MRKNKGWRAGRLIFGNGPPKPQQGYQIIEEKGVGVDKRILKGIKCNQCGKTSWAEGDVKNLYCANCNIFHQG